MSGNSKGQQQAMAHAQSNDKQANSQVQGQQNVNMMQKQGQNQATQNNQQIYQLDPDMIGAIKIKDGLFIGDELASQDIEFVIANKVTHIINCAGKQIMNHWEPIGVAYLAFYWLDQDNQVVLDAKDEASNAIFDFIEEAVEQTESVLVHSVRGQSRATCTLAAYIMRKYKWSLLKSLEFLNSRRPDLEIRATFIHQLSAYEQRLQKKFKEEKFTSGWEDLSEQQPYITSEELILRNTFINARMGPLADFNRGLKNGLPKKRYAIRWIDEVEKERAGRKDGLKMNDFKDDLLRKKKIEKIDNHRSKSSASIRGTLKDRKFSLAFITGVDQMDKHALFVGSQTVRASSKDTKGAWSNKQQAKRRKGDQDKVNAEASRKLSNVTTPANEREANHRQVTNRVSNQQDNHSQQQVADTNLKKTTISKSKSAPKTQIQTPAPESKSDSQKQSATPDMFYKKADNLVEQEDEDDGQEGVGVILQGDKKALPNAPTTQNNVVNLNDEEEDDQILNAIQVDDDEGDSCSDETSKVILKNTAKDGQSAADMRQRASSGSKNLRNSRSERTRSRGGSGGSRGSRTGQRIANKQNQKDQIATGQSPISTSLNRKEYPTDSMIAFTEGTESIEASKLKDKAANNLSQHPVMQGKEDDPKGANSSDEKGVLRRSNNFVSVAGQPTNQNDQNKNEPVGSQVTNTSQRDGQIATQVMQQQQPQNITNIINNNNINNFIINDPKTVAQLQAGLIPTNANVGSTTAQSSQPSATSTSQNPSTSQNQSASRSSHPGQQNSAQTSGTYNATHNTSSQLPSSNSANRESNAPGSRPDANQQTTTQNLADPRNRFNSGLRSDSGRVTNGTKNENSNQQKSGGSSSGRVVKVRQGGPQNNAGGLIVINQQGINFSQGQQYNAKVQIQGQREMQGRHQRVGSDAHVVDQSQSHANMTGNRGQHKRASSHQNQRGPGSLSNQRQGGRNNQADGTLNDDRNFHANNDTYIQGSQNSYLNHGYNQSNYKSNTNHSIGVAAQGSHSGQPKVVANLVQKEMAKRHESPRSRRQIVGQFGPGTQQQTTSQGHAAAIGGKKYSHQPSMNYQGQDQYDMSGAVTGIGSVGMGINVQDINKYFVNDNRSSSHASFQNGQHSKIGNYQYRQSQAHQQLKFGRGASATSQHPKTPQNLNSQQGVDFGMDVNGLQSLPGSSLGNSQSNINSSHQQQNQNLFNRTGPIKIQNRLHDVTQSDDTKNQLNNTLNIGGGRDSIGHKKNKSMITTAQRFNDSLNISEGQASIQDASQVQSSHTQKVMYATGVRFGNPNNQVTKVKKQLNIINQNSGQEHQGGTLISGAGGHKNLAWVAHRHSSVKQRGQQKQQHTTGSDPNIFTKQSAVQQSNVRPGTAPKQAMFNNFADGGQIQTIGGATHFGAPGVSTHHQRKGSTGQDRPLSPYTKVFNQSGSNSNSNQGVTYKRRAHSRREAPAQQMQNLISPTQTNQQRQRPGSTTFHLQFQPQTTTGTSSHFRRSQSPASNSATANRTHKTIYYQQTSSGHMSQVASNAHGTQPHSSTGQGTLSSGAGGNILSPYQRMQGVKRVARR